MSRFVTFVSLVAGWLLLPCPALAVEPVCPQEFTPMSAITFDVEAGSMTINCPGPDRVTMQAEDANGKAMLGYYAAYQKGIGNTPVYVRIAAYPKDKVTYVENLKVHIPAGLPRRLFVMALVAAGLFLLTSFVSGRKPAKFLVGKDNRYSTSKCQMACWFGTVALVYVATLVFRFIESGGSCWGGVGIPDNLLLLTGMSGFSFGAAKGIREHGEESAQKARAAAGTSAPPPAADPSLGDLVRNDQGDLDLGDFQMLFITLLAVAIYLVSAVRFLGLITLEPSVTLPDVDGALLSGFGLGQGAYLFKKAVTPVGQ